MDIKQTYSISFQKIVAPYGKPTPIATTTNADNYEIANHLSNCGSKITELQILDLNDALNGKYVQEDWGEVMGSFLEIYSSEGTVQVNDTNRRIPIREFKQLLEEWLKFIS